MDTNTFSVLTTLGFDIIGGLVILMGWLCIRRYRGDKRTVPKSFDDTEIMFDENFEKNLMQNLLEEDIEKNEQKSPSWKRSLLEDGIVEGQQVEQTQSNFDDSIRTEVQDNGQSSEINHEMKIQTEIKESPPILEFNPKRKKTVDFFLEEHEKDKIKSNIEKLDLDKFLPMDDDEKENFEQKLKTRREQTMRKFSVVQQTMKMRNSSRKNSGGSTPQKLQSHLWGLLDWFHILRNFTDQDLKVICGTDGALYIIFIRYSAIFFGIMSLFNVIIFLPMYATGFPKSEKDIQDSSGITSIVAQLTFLNVTGNNAKIMAVYILMIMFYTVGTFVLIFYYWKRSLSWRYKKHSHKTKFLDHDIALHSIMISGLNKDVSYKKMNERVKLVFEKIFPESKVINSKVIPKYDELYAMAVKLRKYRKYHRYYQKQNEGVNQNRKTLKKRTAWFEPVMRVDAEEYYYQKVKEKSREIREEKQRILKRNGGFGFVTFISNLQVKKCTFKSEFKRMVMENLTSDERIDTQVLQWKIKQAPSQSDIIWQNMYKDDGTIQVKSWFLVFVLFITCVVLITPITLIDNLNPIINAITDELGSTNFLAIMLQTYISPLMFLAFNQGIVPLFIDLIAYLEGHKTKSRQQLGIMRKNFFFQLINTIFLQLTLQTTILSFLDIISNKRWEDIPREISQNLVNNNFFFLRYSIQLAFISNGIQLLDIPHHLVKTFKYICYKREQKKDIEKKPFVDDFSYDLGYYQSQAIVIFCMGLIFSGTCPLISVFCFFFFSIKYYIEKYNLTFVYNREFEGGGVIKKQVIPFMVLSLYLFQILNFLGYFSIFSDDYFKGGFIYITIQSLGFVFLNIHYNNKKTQARKQLNRLEDVVNCENLEELEKQSKEISEQNEENEKEIKSNCSPEKLTEEQQKVLDRKSKLMRIIDGNIMKGTERRLTIEAQQEMSKPNIKKLKEAYQHPFEKIPEQYYNEHKAKKTLESKPTLDKIEMKFN